MLQSSPELVDPVLGVGELALEDVVVLLQLREDLLGLLLLPPLRPRHQQHLLHAQAQVLTLPVVPLLLVVLVAEVVEQPGQPRAVEAGGRSVGGPGGLIPVILVVLQGRNSIVLLTSHTSF